MGKIKDMVGVQFDNWTVKEYVGLLNNRSATWKCECQLCGRARIMAGTKIRYERKWLCDCQKSPSFVGKKFGSWTVIEEIDKPRKCLCRCECNAEKWIPKKELKRGKTKSCGCKTGFKKGYNYKGSRTILRDGYVVFSLPEHPNSNQSGTIREHVYVMSEYIGRPLRQGETVHHCNGIRSDNRIENLELWASNHPPGQRIEDIVSHAKYILETYSDYQVPASLQISPDWFEIER